MSIREQKFTFRPRSAGSDEIPTLSRRAKLKSISLVCGALVVVFTISLLRYSDKPIQNMPDRTGNNISVPQHSGGEKDTSDRIGDIFKHPQGFISHNEMQYTNYPSLNGNYQITIPPSESAKNTFTRKGPKGVTSTTKRQRDKSVRRALISPHGYERHSYHYRASWSTHG